MVAANAARKASTRSSGVPGGRRERAAELVARQQETDDAAVVVAARQFVKRGHVRQVVRFRRRLHEDAHLALADEIFPFDAEFSPGDAERVDLAALQREIDGW